MRLTENMHLTTGCTRVYDTQQWTTLSIFVNTSDIWQDYVSGICTKHRSTSVLNSKLGCFMLYDRTTNADLRSLIIHERILITNKRTTIVLQIQNGNFYVSYSTSLGHSFLTNSNLVGNCPEMHRKCPTAACYNSKLAWLCADISHTENKWTKS